MTLQNLTVLEQQRQQRQQEDSGVQKLLWIDNATQTKVPASVVVLQLQLQEATRATCFVWLSNICTVYFFPSSCLWTNSIFKSDVSPREVCQEQKQQTANSKQPMATTNTAMQTDIKAKVFLQYCLHTTVKLAN